MIERNKLPFIRKFGYGFGALSYGIPFQLVSGCFMFYATSVLALPGTLAGALISVSIFWDAFTDPVMGYISDHTSSKVLFGRRLFYVLIGAVGLAISNYFLWSISPGLPLFAKAALIGLLILLLKTFSTVITTPYLALGAELTNDYAERNSVQSFRTAFFFLGFMFPTVIGMYIFFRPAPGYSNGQLNPAAYPPLGLTASLIILVCAAICIYFTKNKTVGPLPVTRKSGVKNMLSETWEALKCGDFRNVALGLLFINMAMGIVGSVGLHVFTFTFDFNNREIAVVFGALFFMALIAQPVWVAVANRLEKRTALLICLWINVAVSALFFIYVITNAWVADHYLSVLPLAMLTGFSMGGSVALPYSMISDTIDKDAYFSGTRKEGVFYGCATFIYKLSQALSVMFIGSLLDIIKFNPDITQAPVIYLRLGLILPAGFVISFVPALIFISRYTLNRQKVSEYQQGFMKGSE